MQPWKILKKTLLGVSLTKIPISPYSVDMWVIMSKDPHKEVTQTNVSNPGINITWDDGMAAWTNDHFYNGSIIAVVFDTRDLEIDTIAHEAIHIKNMVYSHSGIKHDLANDEPEAYLTGWIVGQIYNCYKESKKK